MEMSGFISVITTCKGRMHHLKETLPTWLAQEGDNYEIIVVDYGDPDKSADYAEELKDPRVRAVRHEAEGFNLSHARNIGALAASEKSDTLMFVDADVLMTSHFFLNYHKIKVLCDNAFVSGWNNGLCNLGAGTSGSCMIWKKDFLMAKGYNEKANGWGSEDVVFCERLVQMGLQQLGFQNGLSAIAHDDWERTKFYNEKNIHRSNDQNAVVLRSEFLSCIP
jgi:hypothetical protein